MSIVKALVANAAGTGVAVILEGRLPGLSDLADMIGNTVSAVIAETLPPSPQSGRVTETDAAPSLPAVLNVPVPAEAPEWLRRYETHMLSGRRFLREVADVWRTSQDRTAILDAARREFVYASSTAQQANDIDRAIQAEAAIAGCWLCVPSLKDVERTLTEACDLALRSLGPDPSVDALNACREIRELAVAYKVDVRDVHHAELAGATFAGRYLLRRLIAAGGMGQVWEAQDTRLGRRVAAKLLKQEFSSDPEFVERFCAEARTVARLDHPGIVAVYDYGHTDVVGRGSTTYLIMELVNGEPLNSVIRRAGRLPLRHALDLLEQTGRALGAAHNEGIVHRDIKPGNILITPTGQVKLTDFGIARAVDAAPVTQTGMVLGTAQYIAPEQALGEDATTASDVYSLGVVGYEAISGKRPFTGDGALAVAMKHIKESPAPLPADVPPNVRELVEITLVKNPGVRYRNGGQFAHAVAEVRAGRRPPRPKRRRAETV